MIYDLRIRSDACIFDFMRLFPKGRVTANLFGCGVVMRSFITLMLWQCMTFENVPHGMQVCHKHAWPGAFFACACGYFKSILRAVILQASSAVNQRLLYRCSHSKNSGRMFSAFVQGYYACMAFRLQWLALTRLHVFVHACLERRCKDAGHAVFACYCALSGKHSCITHSAPPPTAVEGSTNFMLHE